LQRHSEAAQINSDPRYAKFQRQVKPDLKNIVPKTPPQPKTGQSVQTPQVNSQLLDNMLKVVTVVQQIMTEFNGAVSEEDKIVSNLMKQNGH
jgi:hypothetical protein